MCEALARERAGRGAERAEVEARHALGATSRVHTASPCRYTSDLASTREAQLEQLQPWQGSPQVCIGNVWGHEYRVVLNP